MKLLRTSMLVLFGITLAVPHLALGQEVPVYFADPAMKQAVIDNLEGLGISTEAPLPSEMLNLTGLGAPARGITDLTGLEYALNLTDLYLQQNVIGDLTPLASLTSLVNLNLPRNAISHLTPLAGLTSLVYLNLEENAISDITPLERLTSLRSLNLRKNNVSDLGVLSSLENLEGLNLSSNPVGSLEPLENLALLRGLIMGNTSTINDFSPLSGLSSLVQLDLPNMGISSLDVLPLADLDKLEYLSLSQNPISDIDSLSVLTSLGKLNLEKTRVSNISAVSALHNIGDLTLRNSRVYDISPLADLALTTLGRLDLRGNPLNLDACTTYIPLILLNNPGVYIQFEPCTAVPFADGNLEQAVIDALASLDPPIITPNPTVAQIKLLTFFAVPWGVPIADFSGLEYAVNLEMLGLCGIQLETIPSGVFGAMPKLWHVNVSWNNLTDITALAETQNLGSLKMHDCSISDISVLADLTNLWELELNNNSISDISPLANLMKLQQLNLLSNPLNAAACTIYIPQIIANNPSVNIQQDSCGGELGDTLSNGGFEEGMAPWGVYANDGAEVAAEVVDVLEDAAVLEAPIEGTRCLHIDVVAPGDFDFSCGLGQQPLVFRAGKSYTLSAYLKCKQGTQQIRFKPELAVEPWTAYGEHVFTMTDTWAEYSVTTPVFTEDVSPASVTFHIGFAAGEFWMDDIKLIEEDGPTPEIVEFVDPNLKQAVIDELAALDPPIYTTEPTTADMAQLWGLDAKDRGITNLTGLQHAGNVGYLNLAGNNITDASPLSGLTNIWWLNLGWNPSFSNLEPLSQLNSLTVLRIWWDQVTDLTPIAGLTNLQELAFQGNLDLTNIEALGDMLDLEVLNMRATAVNNLTPLSGMTKLRELYVDTAKITDIGPLSGLHNLEVLELSWNAVAEISPLAGLTKLKSLRFRGCPVSDISALTGLVNLEYLRFAGCQVSNISALAGMNNLAYLEAVEARISDLTPLAGLTRLVELYLHANQVSNISPLSGLSNLQILKVSWNPVTQIDLLPGSLQRLELAGCQISDISALSGMSSLSTLYLNNCLIADLSPLTENTAFTALRIQGNPLSMDSYCQDIVTIASNNPGLTDFQYDQNLYSCEATTTDGEPVLPVDTATGTAPVAITFEDVTEAGYTSLTTSESVPTPPAGFELGDPPTFYDITTTASYEGLIAVCINYGGVSVPEPEDALRLLHCEGGQWVDCTVDLDTENNIICGAVTSLSPFAVGADIEAPAFGILTATPSVLWPPNHKMVPITVAWTVTDNLDPNPAVVLKNIVTNEGDTANTFDPGFDTTVGDGNTIGDIQVDADGNIFLRAERSGTSTSLGRKYTLTYEATDSAGNTTTATVVVTVPHDAS